MRKVEKLGPPAGTVTYDGDPRSWSDLEADLIRALETGALTVSDVRTRHYGRANRETTRERLLVEQHYRCVYCERAVARTGAAPDGVSGPDSPRRAHWIPIAVEPKFALDWNNLYVSCSMTDTCDIHQKSRGLGLPHPVDTFYEECLSFDWHGIVHISKHAASYLTERQVDALRCAIGDPRVDAPGARGDLSSLLNLNHPQLRKQRAAQLDALKMHMLRRFPNGEPSRQDREDEARRLLSAPKGKQFVSIQIAWLRRTAGR